MILQRFSDFILLNESLASINEISMLSDDIIYYFINTNLSLLEEFTSDEEFDINNLIMKNVPLTDIVKNASNYNILGDLIKYGNIRASFDNTIKYIGQFSYNKNVSYENGGVISFRINGEQFLDYINREKTKQNTPVYTGALKKCIKLTLIHEIQHAFDFYRSKGRFNTDKRSKEYNDRTEYNRINKIVDDNTKKIMKDIYLTLPHEYYARLSSYIIDCDFSQSIHEVIYQFKVFFTGFDLIPHKEQNKLLKALYKIWTEKR